VITDTHSHIFWKDFDEDREEVIVRARQAGVERMLVVGTDLVTSRACFRICEDAKGLYPTAGIHPHDALGADEVARAQIAELCDRATCVAVGETGLDYFKQYSPKAEQRRAFRWHLELAQTLDKPVIVHCREAHNDTLALLREAPGVRGVMHCYSMGPVELEPYLELGFYISFSGVVTYPKNEANRAAAALVPENRLLVETDCPFLAPQKRRGKRNEPALVTETLRRVAQVRGCEFDELAQRTSDNADELFGLS